MVFPHYIMFFRLVVFFSFSMNVCWGWSWISVGIQQNVFGPIACVVKWMYCISNILWSLLCWLEWDICLCVVRWGNLYLHVWIAISSTLIIDGGRRHPNSRRDIFTVWDSWKSKNMASGAYLDVPTGDSDVARPSEDSLAIRTPRRTPSPSPFGTPRRRKKSGHKGEAGFGSSVINLANTILGIPHTSCLRRDANSRCWNIRYRTGFETLTCSDAGGYVINGCLYRSLCHYICRFNKRDGIILSFTMCFEDRERSFVVFRRCQENLSRGCDRFR